MEMSNDPLASWKSVTDVKDLNMVLVHNEYFLSFIGAWCL